MSGAAKPDGDGAGEPDRAAGVHAGGGCRAGTHERADSGAALLGRIGPADCCISAAGSDASAGDALSVKSQLLGVCEVNDGKYVSYIIAKSCQFILS